MSKIIQNRHVADHTDILMSAFEYDKNHYLTSGALREFRNKFMVLFVLFMLLKCFFTEYSFGLLDVAATVLVGFVLFHFIHFFRLFNKVLSRR